MTYHVSSRMLNLTHSLILFPPTILTLEIQQTLLCTFAEGKTAACSVPKKAEYVSIVLCGFECKQTSEWSTMQIIHKIKSCTTTHNTSRCDKRQTRVFHSSVWKRWRQYQQVIHTPDVRTQNAFGSRQHSFSLLITTTASEHC